MPAARVFLDVDDLQDPALPPREPLGAREALTMTLKKKPKQYPQIQRMSLTPSSTRSPDPCP